MDHFAGLDVEGLGADSEEKHEPVSDIDTAATDGLKALDRDRPISEDRFDNGLSLPWIGQRMTPNG